MTQAPTAPRARRRPLLGAAATAIAVLAAGCGSVGYSEGNGDRGNGKELFIAKCGSCHTLADAGTTGQIGPNLDYAFSQSRKDGLGESSFVQVVRGQIAYPVQHPVTGQPGMPADLVTGQDAEDVAAYVASVAGLGAGATGGATSGGSSSGGSTTPATTGSSTETTGGATTSEASGGEGSGNAEAGKAVFASAGCGSCHTLADAGASGTVGPNLDQAKPAASLVSARVTNGQGAMPSFSSQLSEQQIADVSAYVSSVAGQ